MKAYRFNYAAPYLYDSWDYGYFTYFWTGNGWFRWRTICDDAVLGEGWE